MSSGVLALAISLAVWALVGCGAGAPPYAECTDDLDCDAPSDGCYRLLFTRSDGLEADGNLCTLGCASDADCPEGGACIALGADPTFFCAAPCAASSDCYAGFTCTMVDGDRTMQLCLP